MTTPRTRPPGDGDERMHLVGWLDLQRAMIHAEYRARRGRRPPRCCRRPAHDGGGAGLAPALDRALLVSRCSFSGRGKELNPQFGSVEAADFVVDSAPLAELLEQYEHQRAASNEVVAATPLDGFRKSTEHRADTLTLRWILTHMVGGLPATSATWTSCASSSTVPGLLLRNLRR